MAYSIFLAPQVLCGLDTWSHFFFLIQKKRILIFFFLLPQKIKYKRMTKYIIVSGGVISGIGKGVIASSTGTLLKTLGLRVTAIKIDPYLNIDAGLMSPLDHGR